MKIDVQFNSATTVAYLKRLNKAMSPANQAMINRKGAEICRGRLIRQTPKRWTGQTRRSWIVNKIGDTSYELTNTSKVMRFLENGTRAHGPKTAKRLFVPLTKRAFLAGPRGVIAANKSASAATAGKKGRKKKLPFVVGKDFVFAKRVRGIRAINIVKNTRPFAQATLRLLMTKHLVNAMR
jgi:hypothetical protein